MSNEHGPEYELPNGVSFENFDEFVFEDDLTIKHEEDKSIKTDKQVKINKPGKKVKTSTIPKHKSTNKVLIIAILASLLLMGIVIVFVVKPDKIFPEIKERNNEITITKDNLVIRFDGYNYAGNVIVALEYEDILPQIYECMGVDPESPGLSKEKQAEQLLDEYYFEVVDPEDPEEYAYDIYNGQKLKIIMKHISWTEGETITDEDEITFRFEDTFIVCQGLEEPKEVDIFEDVALIFSGEDGNLTAKCVYIGGISNISSEHFYINVDNGNFSYGDEICVYINDAAIERLYSQEGMILQRESCIYTAEPKAEVVVKLRDITEENMSYMIDEGIKKVESWAENSTAKVIVGDMEYYGAFLYSGSYYDSSEIGMYNKAVIVYTAKAYNENSEGSRSVEIYVPVIFENIVNNIDGSQTIGSNISFRSNLHQDEELGAYICGYRDRQEMLVAIQPYDRYLTADYSAKLMSNEDYTDEQEIKYYE